MTQLRTQSSGLRDKGRTMLRFAFCVVISEFCVLSSELVVSAQAAGGACPSGVPVTGNNCYFIAVNGSDTLYDGTTETISGSHGPWQHAPGMPNCIGNCATASPTPYSSWPGIGIIFRGGDTWHFGNSSLSPYTGGTWTWYWLGDVSTCKYEGVQTGCDYLGVDKTWFSGSSWSRPIFTGDNPPSTAFVASCAYHTPPTGSTSPNILFAPAGDWGVVHILDSIEFTGLCGDNPNESNMYVEGINTGGDYGLGMQMLSNIYIHGWTSTNNIMSGPNISNCIAINGGYEGLQVFDHVVVDGSDSLPNACEWAIFPSFYHMRDSMIRYTTNGVGSNCHDIHDNIFEYIVWQGDGTGHTNVLECNADYNPANGSNQPASTVNVWYNNILRHSYSNVLFWVCPNTTSEYWFNNMFYDDAGEGWAMAGTAQYPACTATGGQFMFNNTFVDGALGDYTALCHGGGSNVTGGVYTTVLNEHLINTAWDGPGCTGGPGSATNVSMTDAQATAQGYTTGSPGTYVSNTCANEGTKPCSPGSSSDSTVGAGSNLENYCNTLASYTSEYAIGTEAANACQYGTTDGCAYDTNTHTMICPAQTPAARPATGAWDVGASQYCPPGAVCNQAPPLQPQPPSTNASSFSPHVYPNPWRSDKHAGNPITFAQLSGNTTIKIFTVSGHLIKTLGAQGSGLGTLTWDLTNDSGSTVASGIYIYLVTNDQGQKARGKLAVIK